MDIIFRSPDGRKFQSAEECQLYEERLQAIVDALVEPGLVDSIPGEWIAKQMGLSREFLLHIKLLEGSGDFLNRSECAKHLAQYADDYHNLASWISNQLYQSEQN